MRVDVKKFLFVGAKTSLDQFLKAMQELGKVQFVTKPKALFDLLGTHGYDTLRALKILSHYSHDQDKNDHNGQAPFLIRNPFSFASEILKIHDEIEHIDGELKISSSRLMISQSFGEIPWEDIEAIEKSSSLRARFFEGSTNRQFDHQIPELIPIHDVGEKTYFISFLLHSSHLTSGIRELHREELEKIALKRKTLQERKFELENCLKARSYQQKSLLEALIRESNLARFTESKASHQTEIDETLFVMTGWSPVNEQDQVSKTAADFDVIVETIMPEKNEVPPTYLENQGWPRVGEDLVHIYDTPSHDDTDPSWWVLGFFALFFAVIVGDAGYGFIFLLVALYLRRKEFKSSLGKRVVSLVTLLGVSCILWGLLCHSFFGIPLSENNPLRKSSLLTKMVHARASYHLSHGLEDSEVHNWIESHNGKIPTSVEEFLYTPTIKTEDTAAEKYADTVLFEAALFIGALHIILGMARYLRRNYGFLGWIFFIIGAYLFLPSFLEATSFVSYFFGLNAVIAAEIGKDLMILGASGALLYAIFKHGFSGIFECMTGVQIFADTLSYLRLYALALAGALVAKMINKAAESMPIVLGAILIISSHAINIVLSIVGGIIHGLRLNFLEWYHYSFEGGGKKFSPLRREERE